MSVVLKLIYYLIKIFVFPLETVWMLLFKRTLPSYHHMTIIVDTVGGSGKSTLANKVAYLTNAKIIRLDDCKFGENWKRYTPDEFVKNVMDKLKEYEYEDDHIVVEGTYSDNLLDQQKKINDKLIQTADSVVWNDVPKIVATWRKLFRSYKRAIGVISQGTAPEKLSNVIAMAKKTWGTFSSRHAVLEERWSNKNSKCDSQTVFLRAKWPFYYDC